MTRLIFFALIIFGILLGDFAARNVVCRSFFSDIESLGKYNGGTERGIYVANDFLDKSRHSFGRKVLVFGDSTNDSVASYEPDRRYISDMLKAELANTDLDVYAVSHPGLGIDRVLTMLRYIYSDHSDIKFVVIPLNLRWMSPLWRSRGSDRMRRAYEVYSAKSRIWPWLIAPFYGSYPYQTSVPEIVETKFGPINRHDAEGFAETYARKAGISEAQAEDELRIQRIKLGLGYELTSNDPLFDFVSKIRGFCQSNDIKCLFYITPTNTKYFEKVAPDAAKLVRKNLGVIRSQLPLDEVLDLADILKPIVFRDHVNEHVNYTGRHAIAWNIGRKLKEFAEIEPGAEIVRKAWRYPFDDARFPQFREIPRPN